RPLRRVVGAAAQDPEATPEHRAAPDHPTGRPAGLFRRDLLPLDPVGAGPDIAVQDLGPWRERGNRLPSQDPDLVAEHDRVVQRPRPPRHLLPFVDPLPRLAITRAPDVEVIVALVHIAADDPQLVLEDDIASGVPPLPVARTIEALIKERIGLLQCPAGPVLGTPDLVVADAWEMLLVGRVPATEEPHLAAKHQSACAIARGKGGLLRDLDPV